MTSKLLRTSSTKILGWSDPNRKEEQMKHNSQLDANVRGAKRLEGKLGKEASSEALLL